MVIYTRDMDEYDFPRRSRRGGGWLLYLIVLALVGGGIYYVWNGSFDMRKVKKILDNQTISSGVSGAFEKTPEKTKAFKEKADGFIKSTIDFVTEKPKEIATNFFNDVKNTAVESARKEAAKVLGPSIGGGGVVAPSNISIVRPARQSLSLLIDADTDEAIAYSIDWGDSRADKGLVVQKESKIIDHIWAESGDYTVKVDIEGKNTGKKSFSFPITILK